MSLALSCVGGGGGGGLVLGRRGDPPPLAATLAGANGMDGPTYAPENATTIVRHASPKPEYTSETRARVSEP